LRMAPVQPTTADDLQSGANLPWRLKMQRARGLEMLGGEQQHLDFCLDAAFFVDFHRRCHTAHIDDIYVSELRYTPASLDELLVESAGQPASLSNCLLDELAGLHADDAEDEHMADLAGLRGEDAAPKVKKPQPRGSGEAHDSDVDDLDFDEDGIEADVRAEVAPTLEAIQVELDRQERDLVQAHSVDSAFSLMELLVARDGAGDPAEALLPLPSSEAGPPASSSSSPAQAHAAVPVIPADWTVYDQHLSTRTPGARCTNVLDATGRTVGQLQPMTGGNSYCVSAVCYCCSHKERCVRMRSWKMTKNEPPEMVDRVLVHWLLSASRYASTKEHKVAKRH
jgi:hypothetical protein